MKILVFTEGTIIMHKNAIGHTRDEIVQQVKDGDKTVHQYAFYVPIGNSVEKLNGWKKEGYEILYLTSRRAPKEIEAIQRVLWEYQFPKGKLFFRIGDETYSQAAERIMPDILIEDDCESIGGEKETTYYAIDPKKRQQIRQILIHEFCGIDKIDL